MKKLFFVATFSILLGLSSGIASATTFLADQQIQITEITEDDLYLVGNEIVVNNDVKGDLIVSGNNIIINGNIYGDLFAVGSNIILNGKVADDARLMGGKFLIKNNIGSDLIVSGGSLTIDNNVYISGDLNAAVGIFDFNGEVGKDVETAAFNLRFNGKVGGNVNFVADKNISFAENASIQGNLSYYAIQKISLAPETVKGTVVFNEAKNKNGILAEITSQFNGGRVVFNIIGFLSLLLIGGLICLFAPKTLLVGASEISKSFGKTLGVGALTLFFILIGIIVALLTIIGIPLAIIVGIATLIALYIGRLVVAMWIGSMLLKTTPTSSKSKIFGALTLGLAICWVLSILPFYLGMIISTLFAILGFGALLKFRRKAFKTLQKANMA